eukprot:CAMPEP_0176016918 /NCGR_PEP_ID=MMETSP0120_2-20121206/8097_1 /TAXON_ID=160619 /ORGANISM="Kryptoperidinium foliaceum, Strain CCMP 1326" /LENGTH=138 /DNA_ID=CAMNT_0017349927 /DNA_START=14 /DNA_END=430 /DNA_ORIENTATION=+
MTKSIPINQDIKALREEEAEQHQHEMLADYKDYIFYSRIVEGMRRKQGNTRDIALRYENQALIDHIVRTRHCKSSRSQHRLSISPTSVRNFGDVSSGDVLKVRNRDDLVAHLREASHLCESFGHDEDEDQDLIFDMDM